MNNEARKQQILIRISKLQETRNYADEMESKRLTNLIEKLMQEYEKLDNS
jgi:hypothetical protein